MSIRPLIRFCGVSFALVLLCALSCVPQQAAAQPRLGLNLEGNAYYSNEITFANAFSHSQLFFAQKAGGGWAQSDPGAVAFGPDGYPRSMAANHSAMSLWDIPPGYPRGRMALLWDGKGVVSPSFVDGDAVVSSKAGRVVFQLPGPQNESTRIGIEIKSTQAADPVRNIRLVPVAVESHHAKGMPKNPFRPEFLKRWSMMGSFRYMDWGATNNSKVSSWDSRAKPTDQTQADRGVALEYQIAHANATKTHPWFNIPHLATDDYVINAATLIRDRLDPSLIARIEYSNEVWNGIFEQATYAREQAAKLPGQQADFAGQLRWYSKRSVEVFKIFSKVFTKDGAQPSAQRRLVRVLAAQSANPWVAQQVLEYNQAYRHVDALAIAPYFGAFPSAGKEAEGWKSATWPQRLTRVERALKDAMSEMDTHRALLTETADEQGRKMYAHIELFAYEGGQHFLGHPDTHEDAALTAVMQQISRRKEMSDYYFRYLQHWHTIGGADFMLFSSLIASSRYGSWGLVEYEGQPTANAPKLQGVLRYLAWAKQRAAAGPNK